MPITPLLILLLASPEPPVNGLALGVTMPTEFSNFCGLECRIELRNVTATEIRFETTATAPPIEMRLRQKGADERVRPIPDGAMVDGGTRTLSMGAVAWTVVCDLRDAFGPLVPGRYSLSVVHPARGYGIVRPGFKAVPIESNLVEFTVRETTLEAARKQSEATEGIEFRVDKGQLVLTNRRRGSLWFWSYGEARDGRFSPPVGVEHWTGLGWLPLAGGFCGTGLVEHELKPGTTIRIEPPAHRDGIVRYSLSLRSPKGKSFEVKSEPAIVTAPKK